MNGPEALRWAADQIIGADRVFDSDHDNALIAARLTELADRIDVPEEDQTDLFECSCGWTTFGPDQSVVRFMQERHLATHRPVEARA